MYIYMLLENIGLINFAKYDLFAGPRIFSHING